MIEARVKKINSHPYVWKENLVVEKSHYKFESFMVTFYVPIVGDLK
jgi:hypothetical protein